MSFLKVTLKIRKKKQQSLQKITENNWQVVGKISPWALRLIEIPMLIAQRL